MDKVTISISNCTKTTRTHVGVYGLGGFDSSFGITTTGITTGTGSDSQLLNATLEIRIYP